MQPVDDHRVYYRLMMKGVMGKQTIVTVISSTTITTFIVVPCCSYIMISISCHCGYTVVAVKLPSIQEANWVSVGHTFYVYEYQEYY